MPELNRQETLWTTGQLIADRFRIYGLIGEKSASGWSIAYAAHDLDSDLPVVVKTVKPEWGSNPLIRAELARMGQNWVDLEPHLHLASAYQVCFGEHMPFITVEFVAGVRRLGNSLQACLNKKVLSVPLSMSLASQACQALAHLESERLRWGIPFAHGNLKLSNMLVAREWIAKITDTWIGHSLCKLERDARTSERGTVKLASSTVDASRGRSAYISPEQWQVTSDIDVRTDIYSFGCILYEMLAGRPVFTGQTPDELASHHLESEPTTTGVSQHIDDIVMRCLQKHPDRRYQSFLALHDDLVTAGKALVGPDMATHVEVPLGAWTWNHRGLAFMSLGLREKAISCYQRCLQISPDFGLAHRNLGEALIAQKRLDEAVQAFEEAIRLVPDDPDSYVGLGVSLFRQGKVELAADAYAEAVLLDPGCADAFYNLGDLHRSRGEFDKAVKAYRRAVEIDPDDAKARNNLGNALQAVGTMEDAVGEYHQALRLEPDYAEAHFNLGNALRALGRQNDAVREYRKALRINPKLQQTHYNLGLLLAEQGKLVQAISEFRKAVDLAPSDAWAHYDLGNTYRLQNRLDRAIESYRTAAELDPSLVHAHLNLGNSYFVQGNLDAALSAYGDAVETDPSFPEVHYNLGSIYVRQHEYEKALASFEGFVRLAAGQATYADLVRTATEQVQLLKRLLA